MSGAFGNGALGAPLIDEEHVRLLKLAAPAQLAEIKGLALKVNSVLQPLFREGQMILVDFKLEFGLHKGRLILADEIPPRHLPVLGIRRRSRMEKDRFRKDLGKIEEAYQEVMKRRVCETQGGENEAERAPEKLEPFR